MNTLSNIHVPFAQLPVEARVLFYIVSFSAYEYHMDWPHTSAEIYADLERVWNSEGLAEATLQDWGRLFEILERKLPKGDLSVRSSSRPGTMLWCRGRN